MLKYVVADPILPPSCVLVKRAVLEDVGLFDTTLRTAEDMDLHLRVARRYAIGIANDTLVHLECGHERLSDLARTCDDAVRVVQGFLERYGAEIEEPYRRAALYRLYTRMARGILWDKQYGKAFNWLGKGLRNVDAAPRARQGGPDAQRLREIARARVAAAARRRSRGVSRAASADGGTVSHPPRGHDSE